MIDAREDARLAITGVEERNEGASREAKQTNLGIVLVEVNHGEAILRSATEIQPTGTLRMSIPYREGCAYTFANGKLSLQVVMSAGVQNYMGLKPVFDTKIVLCRAIKELFYPI